MSGSLPQYQAIIIIGAPRSGTNMLRDALVSLHGVGTWPCDEINYIWRHGNIRYPSDEFPPDMATLVVGSYVRRKFDRFAHRQGLDVLVEKTCANSLRVGFVDAIVADAKYVFVVRDGIDTVASAMLRWRASLDIPYLFRKARYVPVSDLPYYSARYIGNHIHRLVSGEKRLAFWGPRLDRMDELLHEHSLSQVCALQWKACVNNAERDFSHLDDDRVCRVQYERFVRNPAAEFERITAFVGQSVPKALREDLVVGRISADSVGKGRAALGEAGVREILPLIGKDLVKYGYEA